MFRTLQEKRNKKVARETVELLVQYRQKVLSDGDAITPESIFDRMSYDMAGMSAEEAEKVRAPERQAILDVCLRSFEGLAYFLEMEIEARLGPLMVARWWNFCNHVDEEISRVGFPAQSKGTKRTIFEALNLAVGGFESHL